MNILKGYVTYIAAAGTFLLALAGFLTGKIDLKTFIEACLAALAAFGMRRAIGNAVPPQ